MSSVGQNVHGCFADFSPHVYGANRPRGEMSMGRTVCGAKSPDTLPMLIHQLSEVGGSRWLDDAATDHVNLTDSTINVFTRLF